MANTKEKDIEVMNNEEEVKEVTKRRPVIEFILKHPKLTVATSFLLGMIAEAGIMYACSGKMEDDSVNIDYNKDEGVLTITENEQTEES